ncbi:MAG: nucleotidyltransferase domain-containing protein [Rhodospirillaceae bacterium]|nr:nucleotidyltransferase domain-containing protein [Rhodospirillaceae bacterium]
MSESSPQPATVRLNAHAVQRTPGCPLFRTAADVTTAVLADPDADDAHPEHQPWRELAEHHGQTGADERAIRLAHAIYNRHNPDAVIMFGSRATGAYDDRTSDVDIMIVSNHDRIDRKHADHLAARLYDDCPSLDLLLLSPQEFNQGAQYVNTSVTEALLKGVLISAEPDRWHSIYSDPERRLQPFYDWSQYHHLADLSKASADAVRTGLDGQTRWPQRIIRQAMERRMRDATAKGTDRKLRNDIIRGNARAAIELTICTAVAATGSLPKKGGSIERLLQQLDAAAPDHAVILRLTPDQYRGADEWTDQEVRELAKTAMEDVTQMRKLATRLFRRTKRHTRVPR